MVQRLDEAGYLHYERYRGLVLTPAGEALGEEMRQRHAMLAEFLRIIGVPEETVQVDVEGIEHHVSPATVRRLQELTTFLRESPDVRQALARHREQSRSDQETPE
jgi:Mn-dependent DtxR family transcriptional regulator